MDTKPDNEAAEAISQSPEREPDTQPQQEAAPVVQPPAPKKRSKRFLIGIISAVALVLLGAGTVFGYFFWYQNPQKVVTDAAIGLLSSTTLTSDGSVKVTQTGDDPGTVSLGYDMSIDGENALIDLRGELDVPSIVDQKLSLGGEIRALDDTAYIKLNGVGELLGAVTNSGQMDAAQLRMVEGIIETLADEIDEQWIEVSLEDVDSVVNTKGDACYATFVDRLSSDAAIRKDIRTLYNDNTFIVIDETLASKDGNLGYAISFDVDAFRQFAAGLNVLDVVVEHQACVGDDEALIDVDKIKDGRDEEITTRIELWISRFGHDLKQVVVSVESADESNAKLEGVFNFTPEAEVSIEKPEGAVSIEQLQASIEAAVEAYYMELYQDMYGGSIPSQYESVVL